MLAVTPAAGALGSSDDAIPGIPLGTSPVSDAVDAAGDRQDIYSVTLNAGETLALSLSTNPAVASSNCDLDLYLYGPGTASANHASAIARAVLPLYYPEIINYTAPTTGVYYVEVYAAEGNGPTSLSWAVVPEPLLPVYRFYNTNTGTHFYTPSLDEANTVIARWSNVFNFEGIAYYTRASKNTQPLYRFYNKRNGSHFFTASLDEANSVLLNLSRVYDFEGPAFYLGQ
jgi:hypothetical protein